MNDEEPLTPRTPPAVPPARRAPARHLVPYVIFLLMGLWCAFYPMLLSAFRRMEVNTGDTRMLNFILEYSYRWIGSWLTFHPISLWDPPVFFPTANVTLIRKSFSARPRFTGYSVSVESRRIPRFSSG